MKSFPKEFIKKAYESVPMYIKMLSNINIDIDKISDISDLPIITKNDVLEKNSIISFSNIPLLYRNELIHTRTSGSTGKYMDIYWRKEDYNKSMLSLWLLRKKYYGINPDDKMCFFYTITDIENEKDTYIIENQLGFSKSKLDSVHLKAIHEEMIKFSPKWMMLQPSIAILLCECIEQNNLEPIETLKYIEMSGETLEQEVRDRVKKCFGCAVANQYGANEFNSIAFECPNGNMHIMENNLIVEILDNGKAVTGENEGEVFITTITNTAMPLIRYGIGDKGRIMSKKCSCGNNCKIMELTSGRNNDFVLCEAGNKITPYIFVRVMDAINCKYHNVIKQFNIIQRNINQFEVYMVVDEDDLIMSCDIENDFVNFINNKEISKSNFYFYFQTEYIENNGKYSYFKRQID